MRTVLTSLIVCALLTPAAEAVQADFSFKTQKVGKWLVYPSFDYCNMLYDVEGSTPQNRVTLSLTYFPMRKSSMISMNSDNWRSLTRKHGSSIPVDFHFDSSSSKFSGAASVYAQSRMTPSFMLSINDVTTVELFETLRNAKTVSVMADERPLGPYGLDRTAEAVDRLMECVTAAREQVKKDPFR